MRYSAYSMSHFRMDKVEESPMSHEVTMRKPTAGVTGCFMIRVNLGHHLFCLSYSTVCKPRSPRTTDPPPAFSSSSLLGGGLSELDHLLQELNATQFNITGTNLCVCVLCPWALIRTLSWMFSFIRSCFCPQMRSWPSSLLLRKMKGTRSRIRSQAPPPGTKPIQFSQI